MSEGTAKCVKGPAAVQRFRFSLGPTRYDMVWKVSPLLRCAYYYQYVSDSETVHLLLSYASIRASDVNISFF